MKLFRRGKKKYDFTVQDMIDFGEKCKRETIGDLQKLHSYIVEMLTYDMATPSKGKDKYIAGGFMIKYARSIKAQLQIKSYKRMRKLIVPELTRIRKEGLKDTLEGFYYRTAERYLHFIYY